MQAEDARDASLRGWTNVDATSDRSLVLPAAIIGGAGLYSLHIAHAVGWDTRLKVHDHPPLRRSMPAGLVGIAAGAAAGWAIGHVLGEGRVDSAAHDALVGVGIGTAVGLLAGSRYARIGRQLAGDQTLDVQRRILAQSYLGSTLPGIAGFGAVGMVVGTARGAD